ncbi:MAG: hypothetical protein J7497_04445, partial [Chitinophagaceae bacterium]|nr:hypothetical protein [Chitinophagaceae bacterium]
VNSGPVHIAAAVNTPVIVLYALTNPQHIPWMVENEIFYFPVAEELKSKNEVLQYLDKHIIQDTEFPENQLIIDSIMRILRTVYPSNVEQDQYPESLSSQ